MLAAQTKRLSILALIAIIGLMGLQGYWFWRAFDREGQIQSEQTQLALRLAANEILRHLGDTTSTIQPIAQDGNQFLLRIDHPLLFDMVEQEINDALASHKMLTPYRLSVWDCEQANLLMGFDLAVADLSRELPCTERIVVPDCYYLSVRFSSWGTHLLGELWVWWLTALIFLLMIAYFVYNLILMQREKRLTEMRQDFVNNLTHEFRTPITNIGLAQEALQQLLKDGKDQARAHTYLEIIRNENKRLEEQTQRILHAAKADSQGLELLKRSIEINSFILDLVEQFSLRVQAKGGEISFSALPASRNVWVDPFHLGNALSNLIDNAIKYSPQQLEVHIRLEESSAGLIIEIRDQGQGIAKKQLAYLFEPYFRVPAGDRHDVKGFGLGLSYVRQVVEAHQGHISVQSQPNLGSTFKITLPFE